MKFDVTFKDIIRKDYRSDLIEFLPRDWSGNLFDILNIKECTFDDKIRVITYFSGDKINRLFAVHCTRQALMLIKNPDKRSVKACRVQ